VSYDGVYTKQQRKTNCTRVVYEGGKTGKQAMWYRQTGKWYAPAAPSPAPAPAHVVIPPQIPQQRIVVQQMAQRPPLQLNQEVEAMGGIHLPSSIPMGVSPFSGVTATGISPALSPQLQASASPSLQQMDLSPLDRAYWLRVSPSASLCSHKTVARN
jgi:hypothetical protein